MIHADRERQTDDRTEGQTDMTTLSAAFRDFAKGPKILNKFLFKERTTQKI